MVALGHRSVVELGNLVIEGTLHAPLIVVEVALKIGQPLDSLEVVAQVRVLLEQLTLTDPLHEVEQLEEDEVNVGDIGAHQKLLTA